MGWSEELSSEERGCFIVFVSLIWTWGVVLFIFGWKNSGGCVVVVVVVWSADLNSNPREDEEAFIPCEPRLRRLFFVLYSHPRFSHRPLIFVLV